MATGMNKIAVVDEYGVSARHGYADPDVGMATHKGEITAVNSTTNIVSVGTGTEGRYQMYASDLQVKDSGVTNWASDGDHVEARHNKGIRASGLPTTAASPRLVFANGATTTTSS